MPTQSVCNSCGTPLTGGLCPRCLIDVGLSPEPDEVPVPPGSTPPLARLGDYELLEEIGRGGMGVVYQARQISLNRVVAVKLLPFGGLGDAAAALRLRAEAVAAGSLRHPNIVAVHEVGLHAGQHFLAMDFVPGPSLARALRDGPLPARRAATLLRQTARAVQHAHERGIIHRDLKPSNILIDPTDDEPRVTDFGLAKNLRSDTQLTLTGQTLGSPNYIPPEQIRSGARTSTSTRTDPPATSMRADVNVHAPTAEIISESGETNSNRLLPMPPLPLQSPSSSAKTLPRPKVSFASDVYALGAILYHTLTGRPPFLGDDIAAVLQQVLHEEPLPPARLNASVPPDLETICLKCLEKEPARRYQTAQELADELDRFLSDEPIHARPVSRVERAARWCRRKPALAASILLVLLLLLVLGLGGPIVALRLNQSRATAVAERQRAEASALAARRAQYASDMNLAHQAVQDGDFFRARQLLERHAPVRTTSTSSLTSPLDAQPGRRQQGQPLARHQGEPASPDASSPERVRDAGGTRPYPPRADAPTSPSPISHSPTSSFQLPTAPPPADLHGWEWRYLWQQTQGQERFILAHHTNGATAVGVLLDGKTAFTAGRDKFVRLWNLETREQVGELPQDAPVMLAAASPDGRWLVSGTQLYKTARQPLYLWDLVARRQVAVLATNFWLRPSITFSPDGKLLAVSTVWDGIRLWDTDSWDQLPYLRSFYPYYGPVGMAFSPDSRTLAYNAGANGDIVLWDVASQRETNRLTGHTGHVFSLAFSPDGRLLASGGADRVCAMWDVTTRRQKWSMSLSEGDGARALGFTPDGVSLIVGDRTQQLRHFDAETGAILSELRGHQRENTRLAVTPDGKSLLSSSLDGTVRVWDLPYQPRTSDSACISGINETWSTFGPSLCLSPDGRHLVTVFTNKTFSLWDTVNLRQGPPEDLPLTDTSFACVANGGELVAFGAQSGRVVLWNTRTGKQTEFAKFPVPKGEEINRLAFSWDGAQLAIEFWDSKIHVWDVAAKRELCVVACPGDPLQFQSAIMSLAFSRDGRNLMAGNSHGRVWLWRLSDPPVDHLFLGHETQVKGLALLPGGETLVSAGEEIRFGDVRSQTELLQLKPRDTGFQDCALSPDGRRLAVAGNDNLITIWDLASHQEVATLKGHDNGVRRLAFTPSGNELISISKDLLRVWRAARIDESNSIPSMESKKGNTP